MSPRSTGKKAKNSKPLCPLDESIAISPISDTGWDVLLIGAARLFAQVRWSGLLGELQTLQAKLGLLDIEIFGKPFLGLG